MALKTETAVAIGAAAAVTGAVIVASGALTPRSNLGMNWFTDADIARFLTQCTFGVTDADIAAVRGMGSYDAWITDQMDATAHPPFDTVNWINGPRSNVPDNLNVEAHEAFVESFWLAIRNASTVLGANRADLLRQRMQFALSQHFVVSRVSDNLEFAAPLGTVHYYDLLGANAFANFRDLLEKVTLNQMVGFFLSYIINDKEDPVSGRHPDENYAREVMQLFTIGTVQLNPDGTPVLRDSSQPATPANMIPTYSHDDIAGLAKVFTGLSFGSGDPNSDDSFLSSPNGEFVPMIFYPRHHSTSAKSFLGVTIPASSVSNGPGDLKIALDTLFNHPNTPPFFCTRMIKQFVTSNPSPAYVKRIADVFCDNGHGVRGDLAAVMKAILLDDEARDPAIPFGDTTRGIVADPNYGKVREPMIRIANWVRTFAARSVNGFFDIGGTEDPTELDQGLLFAPSVFNFWRPDYSPPHTKINAAGKTAPEFQVVNELTTATYLNLLQQAITQGLGTNIITFNGIDVLSDYTAEAAIADNVGALLDRLNLLLFYGRIPATLRTQISTAVTAVPVSATSPAAGRLNRAKLAVFLSMASGAYLIQR